MSRRARAWLFGLLTPAVLLLNTVLTVRRTPVRLRNRLFCGGDDPLRIPPLRAGQRSVGAGVNDSPVGCQSRAVTEPQRDGGPRPCAVVGSFSNGDR